MDGVQSGKGSQTKMVRVKKTYSCSVDDCLQHTGGKKRGTEEESELKKH